MSWQGSDTVIEIRLDAIILHKVNVLGGTTLEKSGQVLPQNEYYFVSSVYIERWGRYPTVSRLQQFLQSG